MALVWIVYVPTADRLGPDTGRMNRVEEIDDELARMMVGDGSARWPTDDEVAAYEAEQATEAKADGDLSKLSKDELSGLLPDEKRAELGSRPSKADLVAAVEAHRAEQAETAVEPVEVPASTDGFAQPGETAAAAILNNDGATPSDAESSGEAAS